MSNFRPDKGGRRWSLVQARWFSRGAGREGRCRQISLCVGSTRSVPATLGLPRSRVCALPVYSAQAPGCSIWSGPCVAWGSSFRVFHKSTDSTGPAFRAFPCLSSSGNRPAWTALSLCTCHDYTLTSLKLMLNFYIFTEASLINITTFYGLQEPLSPFPASFSYNSGYCYLTWCVFC